jgi:hypothetical protein
VVNVRNLCAYGIETGFDGQRGETTEMLAAIEALLRDGKDYFTVMHDRRGGIGVKHI